MTHALTCYSLPAQTKDPLFSIPKDPLFSIPIDPLLSIPIVALTFDDQRSAASDLSGFHSISIAVVLISISLNAYTTASPAAGSSHSS